MISKSEQVAELAQVAPPLTVASMTVLGFPMSDWVLLLTAIYTLVQIVIVAHRFIARRNRPGCNEDDCPIINGRIKQ